ncbi:MAG: bifunctional folylpolyglutamate synthase/dihydrofolate synthase [Gemmatimonadaceae bacterium]
MGLYLSDYRAALDALFARTTGESRLGLERTTALLAELGNPHHALRCFHIAGTNGKGSVAAMLAALLRHRGHRAGVYTSPHLVDFRERIAVNGAQIPPDEVVDFIARTEAIVGRTGATFFEVTTVMALAWFARASVDVAVLETGLGGRLDATNVVTPVVAGVTSIGLDHREYLGDTLEQIALEKAGIFKPGVPAVIGESDANIRRLLAERALAIGARPVRVVADESPPADIEVAASGTSFTLSINGESAHMFTSLVGPHQAWNAAVTLAMLSAAGPEFALAPHDAAAPLRAVTLPGRFQRLGPYIFDVAHNRDGAATLAATVAMVAPARPIAVVLCVLADKDWRGMIRDLAAQSDRFIMTNAPTAPASRAWNAANAVAFARDEGYVVELEPELARALERARWAGGTVLVTGSFHTVGDALTCLQAAPAVG